MRRAILGGAVLTGLLLAMPAVAQNADVIRETRAAVAQGDFGQAESIARDSLAAAPGDPRSLEALSWVARGALAADDLNLAMTVARDTRRLTEEALAGRSPDVDGNLEIALGAAFEVQAQVMGRQGNRAEGVYLLQRALEQYGGTAVHARLRKNLNLLSLEGSEALPLDASEFLGDNHASLEDLRGGPVLLFFWAHWCPDCKAQAQSIADMMEEFGDRGLHVVAPTQRYGYTLRRGIAAGPEEERQHIADVQAEFYPFLSKVSVPMSEANFLDYGVSTTPTLALVDRVGIVRLYNPGNIDEARLRELIRGLVEEPAGNWAASGVGRLFARLPLDVAAETRRLRRADGLAREHGVERGAQVGAGRRVATRAARVELPPIDQPPRAVEEEEVRRARRRVGLRGRLALVAADREGEALLGRHRLHAVGPVVGMGRGVVGADGHHAHASGSVVAPQPRQLRLHVLHVGAVAADEHHEQRRRARERVERHRAPGRDVGQGEGGRRRAERQHGRRGSRHCRPPVRCIGPDSTGKLIRDCREDT